MRRYRKATVLLLLLAFLVSAVPGLASAGVPPLSRRASVQVLQAYGIVDTKPENELRLDQPVTRAEMAKLLGSALSARAEADASKGTAAFPDTDGHWANGWIAVAKNHGLIMGRDERTFDPNAHVTYAEVVTTLLRLTGYGEAASRDWPWGGIAIAAALGMIPLDIPIATAYQDDATRGDVFRLTATALGRVNMRGTSMTVLQTYQDRLPPGLSLAGFPRTTSVSRLTVSGRADGAVTVLVKGQALEAAPDGSFSTPIDLMPGKNQIPVIAVDGAGNQMQATAEITYDAVDRVFVAPSSVETAAGATFAAPPVYYHSISGRASLAERVTWLYDPTALSYDAATRQFKALRPGDVDLTAEVDGLRGTARVAVAGEAAQIDLQADRPTLAAGSAPTAITVRVTDDSGRTVATFNGNVQLTMTPSGAATIDVPTVVVKNGVGRAYLTPGATPVDLGITAKSSGPKAMSSPLLPISIERPRVAGIRLEVSQTSLPAGYGGRVTVTALAVDQSNAPVPVASNLVVALRSSDNALLSISNNAVIKAGTVSSALSAQNGQAVAMGTPGSATISGQAAGLTAEPITVTVANGDALDHLIVSVVRNVALADGLSAAIVTVTRTDAGGHVSVADKTPIALVGNTSSVSISQLSDAGGMATFAVRATTAGRFTVTAGVPGRPALNATPVEVAFTAVTRGPKAVVKSAATQVATADATTIYVALQGADGGAVPNPGPEIRYLLATSGGQFGKTEVSIPTGATRSEYVTLYAPTVQSSNLSITATPFGGKPLQTLQITMVRPGTGPDRNLTGRYLVAVVPPPSPAILAGDATRVVIQARDGAALRPESYAFDLKVSLDGKVLTALPPNLSIELAKQPVIGLTGRTTDGEAELWIRYTGTGTIRIHPVPRDGATATDQYGMVDWGKSTKDNKYVDGTVTYAAGPLTQLRTSISHSVANTDVAVIRAGRGRTTTVRLSPTDVYGNPTADSCLATLARSSASPADSLLLRAAGGYLSQQSQSVAPTGPGYAEFTVMSMSDGEASATWVPSVTCGTTTLTASPVVVYATNRPLNKPTIEWAGGNVTGGSTISSDQDQNLAIEIAQMVGAPPAVELLVYDGTTLLGRFGPVAPAATDPALRTVHIPVSSLGTGYRYLTLQVRFNVSGDLSDPSDYTSVYFIYVPPIN